MRPRSRRPTRFGLTVTFKVGSWDLQPAYAAIFDRLRLNSTVAFIGLPAIEIFQTTRIGPRHGRVQVSIAVPVVRRNGQTLVVGQNERAIRLRGVNFQNDLLRDPTGRWGRNPSDDRSVPITDWYNELHVRRTADIGFNVIRANNGRSPQKQYSGRKQYSS